MTVYVVATDTLHGLGATCTVHDRSDADRIAKLMGGFVTTQQDYVEMLLDELPYDRT